MTKTCTIKNRELTWKEKIIIVLSDKKWKRRKQITDALGLCYQDNYNQCKAVGGYLLRLIRSGHVVRAYAPPQIKTDPLDNINYVYKWTGKPLVVKKKGFTKGWRDERYKTKTQ